MFGVLFESDVVGGVVYPGERLSAYFLGSFNGKFEGIETVWNERSR
jgi:hypothetical protein